ncbi:hypothetical protein [Methyloglobulus sp.]|uniref:hypothetical protein n=1 Tax=Methyloglobulus sp. TaxID=2518622 RepID=UPI0032B84F5F
MKNFHDFDIYKYEVNCEIKEITLNLSEHHGERTGVVIFKNVLGHHFEHTLVGNIVLEFEEYDASLFYKTFSNEIEKYQNYGLSLASKNSEEFVSESEQKKLKLIVISSSYGMSGWVICSEVTIIA